MSVHASDSWGATDRRDLWWIGPLLTFIILSAFVVYATLRALMNGHYEAGELLSPLSLRDGLRWYFGPSIATAAPHTGLLGLDKVIVWMLDGSPLVLWLVVIMPLAWGYLAACVFDVLMRLMPVSR